MRVFLRAVPPHIQACLLQRDDARRDWRDFALTMFVALFHPDAHGGELHNRSTNYVLFSTAFFQVIPINLNLFLKSASFCNRVKR